MKQSELIGKPTQADAVSVTEVDYRSAASVAGLLKYELYRTRGKNEMPSAKDIVLMRPLGLIRNRHLRNYYTTLTAVVDLLETRDRYTAEHSKRVTMMCFRLCMLLKLPISRVQNIVVAAAIHDIGKIGVPDAVLLKAGPLSDEEYETIKAHPSIGGDFVAKDEKLLEIADIIRHHHERWDGGGYPAGLRGKAIPQGSCMVAICDSIDAMMSDRPYRKGMPAEKCYAEIEKNAGVMYDPDIAPLCLANWDYIVGDLYHKTYQKAQQ